MSRNCHCLHHNQFFLQALHCSTRWEIINILAERDKTTSEIKAELKKRKGKPRHRGRGHGHIHGSNMYYHLSALKKANIIDIAGYKEEKGGAPEKIWKLKSKKITIDLTDCQCNK